MINKPITPEDVDDAIQKMRFSQPKMSSDEAAKKAVELFTARPEPNHCAPSVALVLQEAYDLPGGDLPFWIAAGFRGGVCVGEFCGILSGAAIAFGLRAYQVLEPRTDHEQRIASQAIKAYMWDIIYLFNRKFGSIRCAVLTGRQDITPLEAEIASRNRFSKEICVPMIDYMVRKLVNWGEISQEPPPRIPDNTPYLRLG